jgi:hypothetical protein
LSENDKFKFREFDGSSKLEIHNVSLQDIGQVTCTAINSEGQATSQANLKVETRPQRPSFDKKPQNANVERGQKAVFEAHAAMNPPGEYTWSIDGQKVWNSTQGATIETDLVSGHTRLIIDTNILPNPATVVVTAENKLGSDQAFALLVVNEPTGRRVLEEKMSESGQESVNFQDASELTKRSTEESLKEHAESRTQGSIEMGQIEKTSKVAPNFGQDGQLPPTVRAKEGEQVKCQVAAENADNFNWKLNDQPLQVSNLINHHQ